MDEVDEVGSLGLERADRSSAYAGSQAGRVGGRAQGVRGVDRGWCADRGGRGRGVGVREGGAGAGASAYADADANAGACAYACACACVGECVCGCVWVRGRQLGGILDSRRRIASAVSVSGSGCSRGVPREDLFSSDGAWGVQVGRGRGRVCVGVGSSLDGAARGEKSKGRAQRMLVSLDGRVLARLVAFAHPRASNKHQHARRATDSLPSGSMEKTVPPGLRRGRAHSIEQATAGLRAVRPRLPGCAPMDRQRPQAQRQAKRRPRRPDSWLAWSPAALAPGRPGERGRADALSSPPCTLYRTWVDYRTCTVQCISATLCGRLSCPDKDQDLSRNSSTSTARHRGHCPSAPQSLPVEQFSRFHPGWRNRSHCRAGLRRFEHEPRH